MPIQPNAEQRKVIDFPCGTGPFLVTAAAGSGKTAVIVERVLRLLTDEKNPRSIDRLLVITFTKSAAAELRNRIQSALREYLMEHPDNRRLAVQMRLLHTANICTIDSFFIRLLRERIHSVGMSPDARIADQERLFALRREILERLLEDCYRRRAPDFENLVNLLTDGGRDDELPEMVSTICGKLATVPFPEDFVKEYIARYERDLQADDFGKTMWGEVILRCGGRELLGFLPAMEQAREMARCEKKIEDGYGASLTADIIFLQNFEKALEEGWDATLLCLESYQPLSLKAVRGFKEITDGIKKLRENMKDTAKELKGKLGMCSAEAMEEAREIFPLIKTLLSLAENLEERFHKEKSARRLLSFEDVTQSLHRMLTVKDKEGKFSASEEAESISALFDEVIVDEYQDTNRIQDEIFHRITDSGKKLVMVGDVKQCIYRFRDADPEAFVTKLSCYSPLREEGGSGAQKLSLNANYRCCEGVINFTNLVFGYLMDGSVGGLRYDRDQQLLLGREMNPGDPAVELWYTRNTGSKGSEETTEVEAEAVADEIGKMIDSHDTIPLYDKENGKEIRREITYGDIVILFRSARNSLGIFQKALEARGIPTSTNRGENLYRLPEGEYVLNLLRVLDNPLEDVPLVSLLASAPFGFTPDELAEIRAEKKKANFYHALCLHADRGNTKSVNFLQWLKKWRREAEKLPPGRILRNLYDDLALPALCMQENRGKEMVMNLYLIAQKADYFNGRGGIPVFLHSINRALEEKVRIDGAHASGEESAVRLMTVHDSKGLQFPVVILANTAKTFNDRDAKNHCIYHKELGIGLYANIPELRIKRKTRSHYAVAYRIDEDNRAEELRILYVAMTRAQERFIASLGKEMPETANLGMKDFTNIPVDVIGLKSVAQWINECVIRTDSELSTGAKKSFVKKIIGCGSSEEFTESSSSTENPQENSEDKMSSCNDVPEASHPENEAFLFTSTAAYPWKEVCRIPEKLTVTEIKRTAENPELNDEPNTSAFSVKQENPNGIVSQEKPHFISGKPITAARRGTVFHLAMQLISPEKAGNTTDIRDELARLVEEQYITREEADSVSAQKIASFYASPLGKRVRSAEHVRRELKFTLLTDAHRYYPAVQEGEEELLLQGIIDCLFFEGENIVLIDYKSDHLLPKENLFDHTQKNGYDKQISLYAEAAERIFGARVSECWIYYLNAETAFPVSRL